MTDADWVLSVSVPPAWGASPQPGWAGELLPRAAAVLGKEVKVHSALERKRSREEGECRLSLATVQSLSLDRRGVPQWSAVKAKRGCYPLPPSCRFLDDPLCLLRWKLGTLIFSKALRIPHT